LFHAGGQTDKTKPTVAFRYFAKVPNLTQNTRFNSVGEAGSRIASLPMEPTYLRPALKGPYTAELRTGALASKQMMIYVTAVGLKTGGSSTVHICT
jgi:hypothetical protein